MNKNGWEALNEFSKKLYRITKLPIAVYDTDMGIIFGYPGSCPLCSYIVNYPTVISKCIQCDIEGIKICKETGNPHIYKCHLGLLEAVAPIYENNKIIGYLKTGQGLPDGNYKTCCENLKKLENECKQLDYDKCIELLDKTTNADIEFMEAITDIFQMCANQLFVSENINSETQELIIKLKHYIHENFTNPGICTDIVCDELFISKTKLYQISMSEFGMGIMQYINKLRFEHAVRHLKNTDYSISQIAKKLGYKSANYFIRTFKKMSGTTPGEYKKSVVGKGP